MVSIIVPSYNHKEFLNQRLETILNQTFQDFELIILDDCSNDGSWEILKEYEKHPKVTHCIRNELNSGSPFKQWKKGIELAQNDFIWIAESDDFSDLFFLQRLYEFINLKDLDVVYCQSFDVDFQGKKISDRIVWTEEFKPNIWVNKWVLKGDDFLSNYLQYKNVIPNASACMFKRKLVDNLQWDKILKLKLCGDWLFWALIIGGKKIGFMPEHLNFFRFHSSVSRIQKDKDKKKMRYFEEYMLLNSLAERIDLESKRFDSIQRKWFSLFGFVEIFNEEDAFDVCIYRNRFLFFFNYLIYRIFG